MKEIKAYLRPANLEPVIRELEAAGAHDITVIRVDAIGAAVDEETAGHHFFQKYDEKYSAVAKLEIVCAEADSARFVSIIQRNAHTGARGDGRIFVSIVNEAINIRTGASGEEAL
jgi:nitrogen regulatory protein P-II 1